VIENDVFKLSILEQEGVVHRFEYTYELAWKTLKDFILNQTPSAEIYGSKETIKEAFSLGLIIGGRQWLEMVNDRNLATYTHNQKIASEILKKINSIYYPLMKQLFETMDKEYNK
jgi:nucleotidyltransferase substrate binding protein (TIGR01987 family)